MGVANALRQQDVAVISELLIAVWLAAGPTKQIPDKNALKNKIKAKDARSNQREGKR